MITLGEAKAGLCVRYSSESAASAASDLAAYWDMQAQIFQGHLGLRLAYVVFVDRGTTTDLPARLLGLKAE